MDELTLRTFCVGGVPLFILEDLHETTLTLHFSLIDLERVSVSRNHFNQSFLYFSYSKIADLQAHRAALGATL